MNKRIRLSSANKMALRLEIKIAEERKAWIIAGELNNILEKSEGVSKKKFILQDYLTDTIPTQTMPELEVNKK